MFDCTFHKVKNNHDRLRDTTIKGMCPSLPKIGEQFVFYGKPKEFGDVRIVRTSPITEVEKVPNVKAGVETFVVTTQSGSIYSIDLSVSKGK